MILLSVLCIVISLELGVSTPQGRRYDETFLENKGRNEFSEKSIGEHMTPYDSPSQLNEPKRQENLRTLLLQSEGYNQNKFEGNKESLSDIRYIQKPSTFGNNENNEEISLNSRYKTQISSLATLAEEGNQRLISNEYQRIPVVTKLETNTFYPDQSQFNTYPEDFGKFNQQQSIISENNKENANIERNFQNLKDELPSVSHVASLPQNNRLKSFRPNEEQIREVSVPSIGDTNISNINRRQNSRVEHIVNNLEHKYEEDGIKLDIPVATPEYINSILNEYKLKQHNKANSFNIARNGMENNYNIKPNIQNMPGTFQNPSAEILYKTGQAKPYEISYEHIFDSPQGYPRGGNILSNNKKLKDLYISSKPSKRYMVVYPDGRVEQVDQLENIKKMYPNYVMLHAKELLEQTKSNQDISDGIQESVINSKPPIAADNIVKQPLNPILDSEKNQLPKEVSQNEKDQTTPMTTADTAVLSVTEKVQSSEMNPEVTETKSENVNNGQNPVQQVETLSINPLDTPTSIQEKPIFNHEENKASEYNESISTIEIPSQSREEIFTKEEISPSTNENIEVKNLETPYLELSDGNLKGNITTYTKSDISSSSFPLDVPENAEDNKTNKNLTNETVITDAKQNISVTEKIISKYDDENPDTAAPIIESNINFSTDDSITSLSSSNPGAGEPSTNNTQFGNDFMNITNDTPHSSSEDKLLDEENGFDSSQIGLEGLNSDHRDGENNINKPKVQTVDGNNDTAVEYASPNRNNYTNTPYEADGPFVKPDSNKTNANENQAIFDSEDGVVKENSSTSIHEVDNTKPVSESGPIHSDNEESAAPNFISKDSDYQNPTERGVADHRDPDDDDANEKEATTSKSNDFSASPAKDENADTESSWFNFSETFLSKLMSRDENSFYFLFPRPNPILKETTKTIYSNGTVVIETTETVDAGEGEKTSSKTVRLCKKCETCDP